MNRHALLAPLIAIAALPFALVCCTRASSDAPSDAAPTTSVIDAGSALAPSDSGASSAFTASGMSDASPTVGIIQEHAAAQSPKEKCEQTRRNVKAVIAGSLACSTDADCTQMFTSCGLPGVCGISVAKGTEAKIKAAQKLWDAASCVFVTTAPCPTCAMPPTPKCVGGKCD